MVSCRALFQILRLVGTFDDLRRAVIFPYTGDEFLVRAAVTFGDKYVVFGALSINSTFEDIEHELVVLSNNAIEVIDDMSDYLL